MSIAIRRLVSHPQVRRMIRCAGVSVTTTLLSLAVLGVLVTVRFLPAGWANVVATMAGIGPSYWLNRRFVWGRLGAHDLSREVLPFWAMSLTALVLSSVAVSGAASWADHVQLSVGLRTAVVLAVNVAVFGSLWIAQFFLLDRVLFRSRAPARGTRSSITPGAGSAGAPVSDADSRSAA
jgi:putative flippase GtrA